MWIPHGGILSAHNMFWREINETVSRTFLLHIGKARYTNSLRLSTSSISLSSSSVFLLFLPPPLPSARALSLFNFCPLLHIPLRRVSVPLQPFPFVTYTLADIINFSVSGTGRSVGWVRMCVLFLDSFILCVLWQDARNQRSRLVRRNECTSAVSTVGERRLPFASLTMRKLRFIESRVLSLISRREYRAADRGARNFW